MFIYNPKGLRLVCSDCKNKGRPFDITGIVVGCGDCGNVWDGNAHQVEGKLYQAAEKAIVKDYETEN